MKRQGTQKTGRGLFWWMLPCAVLLLLVAVGAWIYERHHRPLRIAFIPRTTGSTLWEAEHAGAARAASLCNCEIYWNAPTHEDDVEDQIALVDRTRSGRFGGMVLAPDHSLALITPVERVMAAGIPVIIVSSPLALPPSANLSYIVDNAAHGGELAAERVGKVVGESGTVAILGVDAKISGILIRLQAFETYLNKHFPNIRVVYRGPGAFNASEAQQATLTALSAAKQLNAIVSLTAVSTRAAFFTLRGASLLLSRTTAAKQPVLPAKATKLIGFEQDAQLVEFLRQGEIDAVIAEDTYRMGALAVEQLAQRSQGRPVAKRIVLDPVMVTRENADSPEVKRLANMVWFEEK